MKKACMRMLGAGLALGFAAGTGAARADGYRNPPPGGAGLGRAGNMVAGVEDATATHFNPALLGRLSQAEAVAAVTLARSEIDVRSPLRATSKDDWQALPNLFVAAPLADGLVGGLALTTPYGQGVEWAPNNPFAYLSPYQADLMVANVTPAIGWAAAPNVWIGAGVDLYVGEVELRQSLSWSRMLGSPLLPDGVLRAKGDGVSWGARLAAAWEPADGHRVGVAWRSATSLDLDGSVSATGTPPGAPSRTDFETTFEFPDSLALGWQIALSPALRVEVMAEWLRWSANDAQTYTGTPPVLLPPTTVEMDWDDVWTFGVGAEYDLDEAWTLRAGYQYLPSPIPDRTFSPLFADADRQVVSVGAGWSRGPHTLDAAWAFSFFDDRDVRDNIQPAYNGSYSFDAQLLALSYGYRF
jgi:long-chain fatty acid transport protein